ncbi:class I SAM-dependent methyltransferase [Pseudorhodoferax sp.]|uniref:class I SAM-dependent methyltransferase n=1 Tax=Pseudorhodoferax sp. TaxID=1993553 RepID=UPI002DD67493|nr:class I SAM-dependent methyltransferase [Pseudorhodoferax sp.]
MTRFEEDAAWVDYRRRFATVYDQSNYTQSLQGRAMRASHQLVERPFGPERHFGTVVEIGAGTGEHLPFVRHRFDRYVLTDHDAATLAVARRKFPQRADVAYERQSGAELAFEDRSVDRLIASHVLEHIYQPHLALKEWARVVRDGGVLSVVIPTDPGLAWRLGRHLGPRKNALAQGIAYDYVMAREHVNSCVNLVALLRHYFPGATQAWWPIPIPSVDLNLFFAYNVVLGSSRPC